MRGNTSVDFKAQKVSISKDAVGVVDSKAETKGIHSRSRKSSAYVLLTRCLRP